VKDQSLPEFETKIQNRSNDLIFIESIVKCLNSFIFALYKT
jgi:hypothetical protein